MLGLVNRLINDASSLDELLEKLKPYSIALPTFKHICDVAVCFPSSTAETEECFSTLKY